MSTTKIAKKIGCCQETVSSRLKENNIHMRRAGPQLKRTIKRISKIESSYLAGIIDGEGSIFMGSSKRSFDGKAPTITVRNTDPNLAKWLHKKGGYLLWEQPPKNKRTGKTRKKSYHWKVGRVLDVQYILERTIPFLIIKKDKAKQVLKECRKRKRLAEGKK